MSQGLFTELPALLVSNINGFATKTSAIGRDTDISIILAGV
jgi:hypothetical protein